jgi:hypothetical protein
MAYLRALERALHVKGGIDMPIPQPGPVSPVTWGLELQGMASGMLTSVSGGAIYADVITEPAPHGQPPRKHCGPPKYEQLSVDFGFEMPRPLSKWIADSWMGHPQATNGAVVAFDARQGPTNRREFSSTTITKTIIPTCDKASTQRGYITLGFAPRDIKYASPSGTAPRPPRTWWIQRDFRLDIDAIDCSGVIRIESFVVDETTRDLSVVLTRNNADAWIAWHRDAVIRGQSDANERNGTLKFLGADLASEFGHIEFSHLGIYNLRFEATAPGASQQLLIRADLYFEGVQFKFP